jgi:hypothetical protein
MTETCSHCGKPTPAYARSCPFCQTDVGYPNVRAARAGKEIAEVSRRVEEARVSTRARHCEHVLEKFGTAVRTSKAVTCRSLSTLHLLVSTDSLLYTSFYRQVSSGGRLPLENEFDLGRQAIDSTMFPYYFDDIVFGALSLNDTGVRAFGPYSLVLRDELIRLRSSVFEENSFTFCQTKHKIIVGDPVPPGYRALWTDRHLLAMAKLHSHLEATTQPDAFARVLLTESSAPGSSDEFVEVHIFGPIHRSNIEKVIGPRASNRADRLILESVKRKLRDVGAELELS